MDDMFTMYQDTFPEFTDLSIYFIEMTFNFKNVSEQKSLNDTFVYLVDRGYTQAASDLWDNMTRKNFIVNPV